MDFDKSPNYSRNPKHDRQTHPLLKFDKNPHPLFGPSDQYFITFITTVKFFCGKFIAILPKKIWKRIFCHKFTDFFKKKKKEEG